MHQIKLFADIEAHAPKAAIVGSNTSALSITEMAATLSDPSRVAGMHFFNPVHKMKLIEIVRALESSERALETIEAVSKQMGKETVLVREAPGFITTAMTDKLNEEQKGKILGQVPAGRMGTSEEIAAAVLYLSSVEAGYVTGTVLHVNGGMAMM